MKSPYYYILLLGSLLVSANMFSQKPFILNNGVYSYFIGKSEPPANWLNIDFDDSGWNQADTAIIGYGWPKQKKHNKQLDSIVIEKTTSLYIRIKFNVDEPSKFKDLNFEADYNDGYIACLNGEEIARKNFGKPGEFAAFNSVADRSHKATTYIKNYLYYAPVNGVYIDSQTVKRLFKPGLNVFAVHVLNDSVNGSDLAFNANVMNIPNYGTDDYRNRWTRYYTQLQFDSSKFPIVIINTDAYGIPLLNTRVVAQMSIIDKKDVPNLISNSPAFTGRVFMSRRGQTSKDFPKMSFNVETQDQFGENLDTAIMGMPSENDWVLFSSYADKTLLRNELTLYAGRRMGHYEPRTRYCNLILNGEYQGLYIFMENIKRNKNRVSVAKPDSLNPANGGYVFKFDKEMPGVIQYVSPNPNKISKSEKEYLNNFQKKYRDVIKSSYFMDPDSGYQKYISGKSLIDNVVINELTKNCDAYLFSTYFHKDKDSKDGRLKYGPLWDYDLAYCGAAWQHADSITGWQFAEPSSQYLYIPLLFRDTALTHGFARRWTGLRKSFLADEAFFGIIDSFAKNIEFERNRNYEVWHILNKQYLWPVYYTYTYDDDINLIKNWVSQRMQWIDDNINSIYYSPTSNIPTFAETNTAISVYPSPFTSYFNLRIIGNNELYRIAVVDLDGKTICKKQLKAIANVETVIRFSDYDLNQSKNGVYFVVVSNNNRVVLARKIVKVSSLH